jgi:HSP20 family molecular chaperone IbpA
MSAFREALRELPDAVYADLLESDDAYLVVLDLPGTTSETVEATVEDGTLRIEARREKSVPSSFRYVTEERSLFLDVNIPVPADVAEERSEASLDRGVLEVRLPKGSATATTIPVREP